MDRSNAAAFITMAAAAMLFTSLYSFFRESFYFSARSLLLRKKPRAAVKSKKEMPGFVKALGDLASSSLKRDVDPIRLLWLLCMVFTAVFVFTLRMFTLPAAFLIGLLAAASPVAFMAAGLCGQQSRSSREGIALATELNRRYRMENKNIYQALELLVASDGDFPICRKHIYRLLLHLRASASPAEIRAACDSFAFALGTVWGSMLATCIRVSAEKGSDISEGLADIVLQLKNANRRAEERKRLNSEAARMTVWLVPVLYGATMALAVFYLDMSPGELFRNQFTTAEGVMFFMLILLLFMFNRIILKLVDSQKLDY